MPGTSPKLFLSYNFPKSTLPPWKTLPRHLVCICHNHNITFNILQVSLSIFRLITFILFYTNYLFNTFFLFHFISTINIIVIYPWSFPFSWAFSWLPVFADGIEIYFYSVWLARCLLSSYFCPGKAMEMTISINGTGCNERIGNTITWNSRHIKRYWVQCGCGARQT